MKRPTLIVVEDAPNHGAILQDHVAGRFFLGNRGVVGVDRLDHNRGLSSRFVDLEGVRERPGG